MPRLTRIYTRGGDEGETSLGGGRRVSKSHQRVRAYGVVDELNAAIGVALAGDVGSENTEILLGLQNDLFHLGAALSFPDEERELPRIESRHIQRLEDLIDERNEQVGPLENFILPGGSRSAAALHFARTVCRRAEREVVALAQEERVDSHVLPYLNRLSDALFVLARHENLKKGVSEPLWDTRA